MPRKYKSGHIIKGLEHEYEVVRLIQHGHFALSYEVKSITTEEKFFLKQYVSPVPRIPWYSDYVEYQKTLLNRIDNDFLRLRTLKIIDCFEFPLTANKNFFQVFEFVDTGSDLDKQLQKDPPLTWEQRVTDATVFVHLLMELHKKKIIHSDLKPENILIMENTGQRVLKLIDMDFSILSDMQPPPFAQRDRDLAREQGSNVHGQYVGTHYYTSPEHIKGEEVNESSDAFTTGLILYELLTGEHPYKNAENYDQAVIAYQATPPDFSLLHPEQSGPFFKNKNDDAIARSIHGLLNPDQNKRTTLEEITFHLKRRNSERQIQEEEPPQVDLNLALTLYINRDVIQIAKDIKLGRRWAKKYFGGENCLFWETNNQFELRFKDDKWYVLPNPNATNETLLNEKKVLQETCLKDNDILAVGREERGIIKTEILVKYPICPNCGQHGYIFPGPCGSCNFKDESAIKMRTLHGTFRVLHIGKTCNKYWAKNFFREEYKFWDIKNQFQLIRDGKDWIIFPNRDAPNETLLNGRAIFGDRILRSGDRIGVGRESKNIETSILYVDFMTNQNIFEDRE